MNDKNKETALPERSGKQSGTFEAWLERNYPIDHNGRRQKFHGKSVQTLMRDAWNARPAAHSSNAAPSDIPTWEDRMPLHVKQQGSAVSQVDYMQTEINDLRAALAAPAPKGESVAPDAGAIRSAALGEAAQLRDALVRIRNMTDADDPDSYRSDDREGCLDTVFSVADAALSQPSHAVKSAEPTGGAA